MAKRLAAIQIQWDVDYEEDLYALPYKVILPEEMTDEDEISDYLSDLTGYCHYGFALIEVPDEN